MLMILYNCPSTLGTNKSTYSSARDSKNRIEGFDTYRKKLSALM